MKFVSILLLVTSFGLAVELGRNIYIERDASLFTGNQVVFSTWFPYVAILGFIGFLLRYITRHPWMMFLLGFWPIIQIILICAGLLKLGVLFIFFFPPFNFTGEMIAASYFLTSLIIDRKNFGPNIALCLVNAIIAILLIGGITSDYRAPLPM